MRDEKLTVKEVLVGTVLTMGHKWNSKQIRFRPHAQVTAVEEFDSSRTRYGCMFYKTAELITVGKRSFIIACGEAENYYLTGNIDSDLIVIPASGKTTTELLQTEEAARLLISKCKEFSNTVFMGMKDGRILPGRFIEKVPDLETEFTLMQYVRPDLEHPIQYSSKITPYLIQVIEKVIMSNLGGFKISNT